MLNGTFPHSRSTAPNGRIGDMPYSFHYDHRRVLPVVPNLLPDEMVQTVPVVPIALERGKMIVAVLESLDDGILDRIRFIGNRDIESVAIVTAEAMAYAVQRHSLKT